jgi:protease-4
VVVEGRNANNVTRLTKSIDEIANGKIYTARDAEALGLIDKTGYARDAYKRAASMAGLSDPSVVRYADPPSAMEILLGRGEADLRASARIGADGVSVRLDPSVLHELGTPRLMYLWRGQ